MGHTIKVELPDDVYESLRRRAEQSGETPENFLAHWLSEGLHGSATGEDALLRLAGVLESGLADIGERHDDYIGQRLTQGLKFDGGE
jgi:hypothetical protein